MSIEKITAKRGVAKDLVTNDIAILKNHLMVENGKFLLDKIDGIKAQELYKKLKKTYTYFYDLHLLLNAAIKKNSCAWDCWWHSAFSSEERFQADLQAEKQTLEKNKETYSAVREDYIAVKSQFMQYDEALALSIEEKQKSVLEVPDANKKIDDVKAEDSARYSDTTIIADAVEVVKNKTKALS